MIRRRRILRVKPFERGKREEEDSVAVDELIHLFLNGNPFQSMVASRENLEELAIGHLFGEGIIKDLKEITEVRREGSNIYVTLKGKPEVERRSLLTAVCGAPNPAGLYLLELLKENLPRPADTKFETVTVLNSLNSLHLKTRIFRETGGTHAAALFTKEGELKGCLEDVGRHNAIDKVLGLGLKEGIAFGECFLASTGRLSAEMVAKGLRASIPLMASRSAPLESGIALAEAVGMTLVGFARGSRLNVYTHPERLEL